MHTSVFVMGAANGNPDSVLEQLAPFNSDSDECDSQYLQFKDMTADVARCVAEDKVREVLKGPDGTYYPNALMSWDSSYMVDISETVPEAKEIVAVAAEMANHSASGDFTKKGRLALDRKIMNARMELGKRYHGVRVSFTLTGAKVFAKIFPEGFAVVNDVPVIDVYKTVDAVAEQWMGLDKDPSAGVYGYWYNPNGRWDWWVVGGRWANTFTVKHGNKLVPTGPKLALANRLSVFEQLRVDRGKATFEELRPKNKSDAVFVNTVDWPATYAPYFEAARWWWGMVKKWIGVSGTTLASLDGLMTDEGIDKQIEIESGKGASEYYKKRDLLSARGLSEKLHRPFRLWIDEQPEYKQLADDIYGTLDNPKPQRTDPHTLSFHPSSQAIMIALRTDNMAEFEDYYIGRYFSPWSTLVNGVWQDVNEVCMEQLKIDNIPHTSLDYSATSPRNVALWWGRISEEIRKLEKLPTTEGVIIVVDAHD